MHKDERLAVLYDYTKFHIGIYLSFAAGIGGLLASGNAGWFLTSVIQHYKWLYIIALILMLLAGMCGGMVASSTAEHSTYEYFWNEPQWPQILPDWFKSERNPTRGLLGRNWVMLEHLFFWCSMLTLFFCVTLPYPPKQENESTCPTSTMPMAIQIRAR